jgi:hypothetical protein
MASPAGYSGTALAKKLGIKDGAVLALLDAPASWSVPDLPGGVEVKRVDLSAAAREPDLSAAAREPDLSVRFRGRPRPSTDKLTAGHLAEVDIAVAFCRVPADVRTVRSLIDSLPPQSALWVAWPRKAGGHLSDVDENLLREVLLPAGVVDVKVAALDADWSGLKFVWRKENRARAGYAGPNGEAPAP